MASNKQVLDILPSKGAYPMAVGDEQSRNWTERQWDYQLQKEGATYDEHARISTSRLLQVPR